MTEQATAERPDETDAQQEHHHPSYVKVWAVLVVLLVISVLGPMVGIQLLTLITAFGIAIVKAYLVARNFMHIDIEPKYLAYLLVTCIAFMVLLFAGVAPDVMRHDGHQWANVAAKAEVRRAVGEEAPGGAVEEGPFDPAEAFAATCASCHGEAGHGDGPASAALDPKPANFTEPGFWETRDRAHVEQVIRGGGASVGKSPTMPSFGAQFSDDEIEELAAYVVGLGPQQAGAGTTTGDAGAAAGSAPDGGTAATDDGSPVGSAGGSGSAAGADGSTGR